MRCVIAKINPVLINLAIKHYLAFYDAKGKPEPTLFTFKSLYNDAEPYPLNELIFCIDEQLALLNEQFTAKSRPVEYIAVEHGLLKRKRHRLQKLLERTNDNDIHTKTR